jgi:hypothetical protein
MKNLSSIVVIFLCPFLCLSMSDAMGKTKNGFDLADSMIPVKEIRRGGPPRDGIPALNYPAFVPAEDAGYVKPDDRVIGVVIKGKPRAYPIKVLNWHEVVNDVIGKQNFVITYCPLCGTGMVFGSNFSDGVREGALVFGVSGLLYNSDVLLYDRQTESLWSQIMGKAVTGKLKNSSLKQLPAFHTNLKEWLNRYPNSEVLAVDSRNQGDYERNPYEGYEKTKRLMFKVNNKSSLDFHPKEWVLGLKVGEKTMAFPFSELRQHNKKQFGVTLDERTFTLYWNDAGNSAYVRDSSGKDYASTIAFWFAWYAFHPETDVFRASK